MTKKDFLNKRFEHKVIDKILIVIVFLIIFLSPPLILYTYLLDTPIQERLTCDMEFCKINQFFALSENFTTTIQRPTKILVNSSVGKNLQHHYFLYSSMQTSIFATQYHRYKSAQRDKQLIESKRPNITIVKNDSSLFLLILLNLIDILFVFYCIKYWLKHKTLIDKKNH